MSAPLRAPRQGELPARLHETAELIAAGLSNRAIAARLSLSEAAIKSRISRIYEELDLMDDETINMRVSVARYVWERELWRQA